MTGLMHGRPRSMRMWGPAPQPWIEIRSSEMLRTGDLVDDFTLLDHRARPWTLADHRGQPVLLVFHRHLM